MKIRRDKHEQYRSTDIHRTDNTYRKGLRGSTAGRIRERFHKEIEKKKAYDHIVAILRSQL